MSNARKIAFNLLCALAGAVLGAVLILGAASITQGAQPSATPSASPSPSPSEPIEVIQLPRTVAARRTLLLAWAPGGVPPETEGVLEKTRGVIDATTVEAGLEWIRSSRSGDGTLLDRIPKGMSIPVEVAYVEPGEYAGFVPPAERDAVRTLERGDALLADTETRLRGAGSGLRLKLSSGKLRATGVLSDVAAGGYEIVTTGPLPRAWTQVDRFVLMHLKPGVDRERVRRRIEPLLEEGQLLRVKAQGETPFLRYGDAVLPQLLIKETFGEFAARPLPDGRIAIDPRWTTANIRSGRVPVLGEVSCHRALFPQLRAALKDVVAEGLTHTINPRQFGGCYGPRFVSSNPKGRISHHAWGVAIDINVAENAFGTRPDQDRRLVEIMLDRGFTWGGDWLIPDGMHFEWIRFP